jgi:hypothetical protein
MCNGHSLTENCPFGCNGYVTAVAVGQSQRLYSGVGLFNWHYLSSPPQIPRLSRVVLDVDTQVNLVRLRSNTVLVRNTMG